MTKATPLKPEDITIELPPVDQQMSVTEMLAELDKDIEQSTGRDKAILEQHKKDLMEELFTQNNDEQSASFD